MSLTKIRRKDRAVNDNAWIANFLQNAPVITISFTDGEQPFIRPTLFVYDPDRRAVYFHATEFGRTTEVLKAYPQAALTAFEMGRLLPAERAMDFSLEYASVAAYGQTVIIEDAEEAIYGLQLLLDKYFPHLKPGDDYAPTQPVELKVTAVFRLDIREWTGKQKKWRKIFPTRSHITLPILDRLKKASPRRH